MRRRINLQASSGCRPRRATAGLAGRLGAASLLTLALTPLTPARGACPVVAAGHTHSLALHQDGTVWSWGDDSWGELGVGRFPTGRSNLPLQVKDATGLGFLTDVVAIAATSQNYSSFALRNDGTVWSWGANQWGQLGEGSTANAALAVQVMGPAGVGFLSGVTSIGVGSENHVLALKGDGTVWAWGGNVQGQLGQGTSGFGTESPFPVQVRDQTGTGFLSGVIAVAGGRYHSLALSDDGMMWAWGSNNRGELGNGTVVDSSLPVRVKDENGTGFLSDVTIISAGLNGSLALKRDGTLWSWGVGNLGQLGDGRGINSTLPVQVRDTTGTGFLTEVTAISVGGRHTLAVKADGTLWAWGNNVGGQLGMGTGTGFATLPSQVRDASGAGFFDLGVTVSASYNHSMALKTDGTVWAWSWNNDGQLGDGTWTPYSYLPVPSLINVGSRGPDPIPPDQGNTLRAVKRAPDVSLSWIALAPSWRVYHDSDKRTLGTTPFSPDVPTAMYEDIGALLRTPLDFYRVKGLSPCSLTTGP